MRKGPIPALGQDQSMGVHQEGKAMAMFPSSHHQGVQAVLDVMENAGVDFSGSSRVKHE